MTHIFISYAKKDTRDLALSLADGLNAIEGVTAWVDRSLKAGRSWEAQIEREIDKCDMMVVLCSPDINRHKKGETESYVLNEIAYAQYQVRKPILPIMIQQTQLPISLARVHYIDFTIVGLTLDDLIDALCDELGVSRGIIANVPVTHSIETNKEAITRAQSFVGMGNIDWQPYITTLPDLKIPDMPFCLVPVGSFQMGSNDEKYERKTPIHSQYIEHPYYIAQYPVTNMQWQLGVEAGVVREPSGIGSLKWYRDNRMSNTPVVGVSWHEARNFAEWMGCRLPTELEWEYGARGVESLRYSWGNDWILDNAIVSENSGEKPWDVTSKSGGKSWVGAYHMNGNVWEWTSSIYRYYPYTLNNEDDSRVDVDRVLRGGSWVNNSIVACAVYRYNLNSSYCLNSNGIRLCCSID